MALERIGHYTLDTVVARGDIATLYTATDTRLQRIVLLRVLPGDIVQSEDYYVRLRAYAPILLKLNHPTIVPITDIGSAEGHVYMAMRHMGGGSLADRLVRGALPFDQAAAIFRQTAEALDYAHGQGLVHAGLRPTRILFDVGGNATLSGFGQPTLRDVYGRLAPETVLRWMTAIGPEQLQPDPALDAAGDQYALAVLLYEMLAGHPPFHAQTSRMLASMHLHNPVPPLPDTIPNIPPVLNDIISRAMAKAPSDRFAGVGEMAAALLPAGPTAAREPRRDGGITASGMARPARRSNVGLLLLAGMLVLVAVLAFFLGSVLLRGSVEETVDPVTLAARFKAPKNGIEVSARAAWTSVTDTQLESLSESVSVMAAAPNPQALDTVLAGIDSLDFAVDGPVFLALVSDAAEIPGLLRSPRLVFEAFKAEIPILEDLTFGPTRSTTVDGNDAVYADFSGLGQGDNASFAGRIVAVLWADRVGFFVGVAPADQWEDFRPTFNGMIQSLKLSAPVGE